MVMNRRKNSALLLWNITKCSIETPHGAVFVQLWANAAPNLPTAFSGPIFLPIWDVQHFLICLQSLLSRALLVDDHPIPYCGFSSPFLAWSPYLVDYYDVRRLVRRTSLLQSRIDRGLILVELIFFYVYIFTERVPKLQTYALYNREKGYYGKM